MKTYSVKEISELLGTNPETIRRWIRSGKLKATQPSKKEGNLISSADLQVFLKGTPKYSSVAAKSLAIATPLISFPLVFGGVLGTLVFEHIDGEYKIKNANISASELIQYLQREIFQHSQSINEKKQDIIHLQSEIQNEQMQIDALKSLVSSIETSLGEK